MANWFYKSGEKEIGPLSDREIMILAKQGKLTPKSPIRRDTENQWRSASSVLKFPGPTPAPKVVEDKPTISVNSTSISYGLGDKKPAKSTKESFGATNDDKDRATGVVVPPLVPAYPGVSTGQTAASNNRGSTRNKALVLLVLLILLLLLLFLVLLCLVFSKSSPESFLAIQGGGNTSASGRNNGAGDGGGDGGGGGTDSNSEGNNSGDSGGGQQQSSSDANPQSGGQPGEESSGGMDGTVEYEELHELDDPVELAKLSMTIRLKWKSKNDLDLSVKCPDETDISYANVFNSGGYLARMGNNTKEKTETPEELITWTSEAPVGRYEVIINFDSADSFSESEDYVLVVTRGGIPQEFTGTILRGQNESITNFKVGN